MICFDKQGAEREDKAAGEHVLLSERILSDIRQQPPTDIFLSGHGWKGDVPAALDQYDRWFGALLARQDDMQAMGRGFRPLWIGLHWPSLPFGEETLGGTAFAGSPPSQAEIMEKYVAFFDEDSPDIRDLLQTIFRENTENAGAVQMPEHVAQCYRELGERLGYTSGGLDSPPDSDGVPFDPLAAFEASEEAGDDFAESAILSGLLSPIRQLSFWTMKKRARRLGEDAMHRFCTTLLEKFPEARLHLLGHSFGCIAASSILGGPGGARRLPRPADSLFLIQGAVSLWAYADHIEEVNKPGYFNAMLRGPAVRGPIVTTRSTHDWAVGSIYPLAVGLVGQVSFGVPVFGGIGTWGMQGLKEAEDLPMRPASASYPFKSGGIYNLEASPYIGGHSLIDGPEVAHAIWAAVRAGSDHTR
jgi:hypothetical protein